MEMEGCSLLHSGVKIPARDVRRNRCPVPSVPDDVFEFRSEGEPFPVSDQPQGHTGLRHERYRSGRGYDQRVWRVIVRRHPRAEEMDA
jgi:hypothetical protein